MCDPTSAGLALAGLVASQAMKPKMPKMPELPTPEAPRQAARAPDEVARRAARTTTNPMAGIGSTQLTGPLGVAASALNLGSNTLVGQ